MPFDGTPALRDAAALLGELEALAMVDAMENPTADDLHRLEHVVLMLNLLEEQGEPLPPLPDAKFTPTPPGIQ
jgi:hypothetical protein